MNVPSFWGAEFRKVSSRDENENRLQNNSIQIETTSHLRGWLFLWTELLLGFESMMCVGPLHRQHWRSGVSSCDDDVGRPAIRLREYDRDATGRCIYDWIDKDLFRSGVCPAALN